ncbi:hypothetical protein PpBr36_08800 [Pyricularia pennisetigena]|uniref:hypothetical protein n=1 Tax=Pyricularia pennisetigena TaxID=1578925 RepID=UPI00114DBFF0|nr:hypothetical protein PpBr36_08800 [Pyricularia pennisetigena]TLS24407.1 hypothetical protein PpBr36_08800 [Pyricularia pennisetigena]
MSYPDAMDQDHAAPPPAAAANDQDAEIGQVATAMQVVTEVCNAPATSIEGTPTPQVAQSQNPVPSTETAPTTAPATSAAPQQPQPAAGATQPAATTASPAPASPAPARTGTPMRNMVGGGGGDTGSRAGSLHPEPSFNMPAEAATHGAPARVYLNTKVTGVLLEGMKIIAKDQPNDPLRVLGEFLLQRSKEIESTS